MKELRVLASAAGCDADAIEDARDAADPQAALQALTDAAPTLPSRAEARVMPAALSVDHNVRVYGRSVFEWICYPLCAALYLARAPYMPPETCS